MIIAKVDAANPSIVRWPTSEYSRVTTAAAIAAARTVITAMATHKSMPIVFLGVM
jgi:hypothetical protein